MLCRRTQPVHALIVAAAVAGLGAPITTPGVTPSRPISLSNAVLHPHTAGNPVNIAERAIGWPL